MTDQTPNYAEDAADLLKRAKYASGAPLDRLVARAQVLATLSVEKAVRDLIAAQAKPAPKTTTQRRKAATSKKESTPGD